MVANPVRARVKSHGHFVKNRKTEIIVGFTITIIGLLLLWDAFDGRDKKMPWPISGMAPW